MNKIINGHQARQIIKNHRATCSEDLETILKRYDSGESILLESGAKIQKNIKSGALLLGYAPDGSDIKKYLTNNRV